MATVKFSVPWHVKEAFDKTFAGENKSAVLTQLMQGAVDAREREAIRARAIEKLLKLRTKVKSVRSSTIQRARQNARP